MEGQLAADPEISVIIPCHRAGATIGEAVRGVLAQSLADWELILVSDDGESYLQILAGQGLADPRIREHPERTLAGGHTLARDRGLALARGRLIADLDADDAWYPERLARLAPLARRHGAAQDLLECFDQGGVIGLSGPADGGVALLSPADVLAFDTPFHLLARRDALGAPWARFPAHAPDPIRTALIAARQPVAWLRLPLLRYRIGAASMTQSAAGDRKVDAAYGEILEVLEHGDGYGLPADQRPVFVAGIRRKRALNRAHMEAAARDPDLPPFVAWVLAGRPDGAG